MVGLGSDLLEVVLVPCCCFKTTLCRDVEETIVGVKGCFELSRLVKGCGEGRRGGSFAILIGFGLGSFAFCGGAGKGMKRTAP